MLTLASAAADTGHSEILCTILLIATIIAFILGLAEALGLTSFVGRTGNGRFSTLVVAVILLVVYVLVC